MIKALRIDERLIHGQVAVAWCTTLGVDSIVVANDEAAADDITMMSLKMAAPQHLKVVIKTVQNAVTLLNDPRIVRRTILLLVTNPKDALDLIKHVEEVPDVNVGNFGMFGDGAQRRIAATSFAFTQEEKILFKEIIKLRPGSYYQMTPTLEPQTLSNLL